MSIPKTVLLVDDDPTQHIILQAYFLGMGSNSVQKALNAREALDYVKSEGDKIELIVCDLMMPDMDGIEMLRALKDHAYRGAVALISSLDQTLIDSSRRLGELHDLNIIGTVRKPLTKQTLDQVFLTSDFSTADNSDIKQRAQIMLSEIQQGFERREFVPFYQPKVHTLSGVINGAEALVRWQHPEQGVLEPADFIPLIENHKLMASLTKLMLEKTMADIALWKKNNINLKVAVNVTASDVSNLDFLTMLKTLMSDFGINNKDLAIEITETEMLDFNAVTLEVLSRLRMMGIDVAIDDFGTGASNLKTLKEFPYSELKIDQSFIRDASDDAFSQETVRLASVLGRQLNMKVLAEGVESSEDWQFIKQRGIDEAQGYFVSKPMDAETFLKFYLDNNGKFTPLASSERSSDQHSDDQQSASVRQAM